MPVFKLPLSSDVTQFISPFSAFGSQFGLINITLGQSSNPEVEKDVLSDYGTCGKQIGQIGDAFLVLIERMSPDMKLDSEPAIITLKKMLDEVANIKERHHRKAIRPRPVAHDGAEGRPGI